MFPQGVYTAPSSRGNRYARKLIFPCTPISSGHAHAPYGKRKARPTRCAGRASDIVTQFSSNPISWLRRIFVLKRTIRNPHPHHS